MKAIAYKEKPVLQEHVSLSSKGQIIIVSKARKNYLPKDLEGFDQDVFSDGTIVLHPRKKLSKAEEFKEQVENYFSKYGPLSEQDFDQEFLASPEVGGEIID